MTPVKTGDPSLSLSPKKLAGSAMCLNCGTELKGPFCYFCGQPDRNFMRFFPVLLRDFMEDLLDLDRGHGASQGLTEGVARLGHHDRFTLHAYHEAPFIQTGPPDA